MHWRHAVPSGLNTRNSKDYYPACGNQWLGLHDRSLCLRFDKHKSLLDLIRKECPKVSRVYVTLVLPRSTNRRLRNRNYRFLGRCNWEVLYFNQLPRNHLFPKLKEHLGGQRFRTDDEVKEEVTRFLNGLPAEFCGTGILKLEHQLQKCLEKDGDYVEK